MTWSAMRRCAIIELSDLADKTVSLGKGFCLYLLWNTKTQMSTVIDHPQLRLEQAVLIELFYQYALPGSRVTQLEIQKLMYFLQVAGESLRLNYVKQQYGPYAENLHFVLQHLEGHYLRGYGARSGASNLYLLPGADTEAE